MQGHQDWLLEQRGHIATLTLNRPHAKNNLSHGTLDALCEITGRLAGQSDVRVVILASRGPHFSTGVDLDLISAMLQESEEAVRAYLQAQQSCLEALAALPKPTLARLHGFCIGGGLLLAACCDFRIASARTIFQLPEVRLGLPVLWGTHRIIRLVGEPVAKEMLLLCRRMRAQDALRYGLVNQVVSEDALDHAIQSMAEKFQQLPPKTVAAAKGIIQGIDAAASQASQKLELDSLANVLGDPDALEALRSYRESRGSIDSGGPSAG